MNDEFIEKFLERAKRRQEKLEATAQLESHKFSDQNQHHDELSSEKTNVNFKPNLDDSNLSSDLDLDVNNTDNDNTDAPEPIYRAEPVVCQSDEEDDNEDQENNHYHRNNNRYGNQDNRNLDDASSTSSVTPPLIANAIYKTHVSTIEEADDDDEEDTSRSGSNASSKDHELELRAQQNVHVPPMYRSPKKQNQQHTNQQQQQQNHINPPLQQQHKSRQPEQQKQTSKTANELLVEEYVQKVERARNQRLQLVNAVESAKQKQIGSRAHLEAAKLLLIAGAEEKLYATTLQKYSKNIFPKKSNNLGSIKLSSIRLRVSDKLRNDMADENIQHSFFCIATCCQEVKSTELVSTVDIRRQDVKSFIHFKQDIKFDNIPPEFQLKLEVFELVIYNQITKFLSKLTPSKTKKTRLSEDYLFHRVGAMRISIENRDKPPHKLDTYGELERSKYIESECRLNLELKSEHVPTKMGMLHVRTVDHRGYPDWSRYFAQLGTADMKFWRNSQDFKEGEKPLLTVALSEVCCEAHKMTPDDDLYRQNSFIFCTLQDIISGETESLLQRIVTKGNDRKKLVKHQLASETKDERDQWCRSFNHALESYTRWHGGRQMMQLNDIKEKFMV